MTPASRCRPVESTHMRMRVRRARPARGFTLIELLAALAILAVMGMMAIAPLRAEVQRSKERELRAALQQIREAIDEYKRAGDEGRIAKSPDASGWPPSLDALVRGVPALAAPGTPQGTSPGAGAVAAAPAPFANAGAAPRRIYFLRRLPRDPFADAALPPERTWGLRSSASAPDDPQPGVDVFDVYSMSSGVGSNGVPFRRW